MDKEQYLEEIKRNVVLGHADKEDEGFDGDMEGTPGVSELVQEALDNGVEAKLILERMSSGMETVGGKFESGEYLIPDMLAAAECVGAATEILEPHLLKEGVERKGRFVMATVEGDLHDIGKNIVITMLKGDGYEVRDLGVGVDAADIVTAVKESGAQYLGLSALLTTTMVHMKDVLDLLEKEGLRDKVKVLIGGAPTSEEFAKKIGADAHCRDAFEAVHVLRDFSAKAA
ncbi:MAG: cobalamin-binding protein [Chitinivibrionales bacterium]|nr:cobalamin-binding protein [Chitinivibrionales bacterium]MBD3394752.1 cobalamin-binding protein [Chitinivibrionales bacterium]